MPKQLAEDGQERYWRPREDERDDFAFASGFLKPWPSAWDTSLVGDLVRLSDLADVPLLILLGEPGSGKSTDLIASRDSIAANSQEIRITTTDPRREFWFNVDLAELSTRQDVISNVFAGAQWEQWRNDPSALFRLDIDSIDECHVDLPTIFNVLLRGFSGVEDVTRLRVRLVCRTGIWPVGMEPHFQKLFAKANVCVLDIAPLTQAAARAAALDNGVGDVDQFFEAVEHRGVEALAARPVTLKLLCTLFCRNGDLPTTLEDLYQKGCDALAEETNISRRSANKTGKLAPAERVAIARRLAAVMIFTATDHIWIAPDLGERVKGDLIPRDVAGGDEPADLGSVAVTEEAVREVVTNTGFFTGAGPNRFAWTHRTIAEFLAASFLRARQLSSTQILQVLMHPLQPRQVVPQLAQVAAWVAGFDAEFFRFLASTDPEVLLSSDVQSVAPVDRKTLVEGILSQAAARTLDDSDTGLRRGYRRLAHDGLAEQLRAWIVDRGGHYLVRRIAIHIAEACKVRALVDALVAVSLDENDQLHVRDQAAHAIRILGNRIERERLRPLLDDPRNKDAQDQLKGSALRALWPDLLSAHELFSKLTPPKDPHFHGTYAGLMMFHLPESLTDNDLAIGLRWAAKMIQAGARHEFMIEMDRLIDTMVSRALRASPWQDLDAALVEFLWIAADEDDRITGGDQQSATEVHRAVADLSGAKRDALLSAIVDLLSSKHANDNISRLMSLNPPLLRGDDVQWCLKQLAREKDQGKRRALAQFAAALFWLANHKPLDEILAAAAIHPELGDALPELQPVMINGPAADAARKRLESMRKVQQKLARPSAVTPNAAATISYVDSRLRLIEGGDPEGWIGVVKALVVGPSVKSRPGDTTSTTDLTTAFGWEACDEGMRGRVLAAAEVFLVARNERADEWFERDEGWPGYLAYGLQALTLLLTAAPNRIATLPAGVWKGWMASIMTFPSFEGIGDLGTARIELLKRAMAAVPSEFRLWIERILDREARRLLPQDVTGVALAVWDDDIATALLDRAVCAGIPAVQFGHVIGALLRQKVPAAMQIVSRALGKVGRRSYYLCRNSRHGRPARSYRRGVNRGTAGKSSPSHARRERGSDHTKARHSPLWWERAIVSAELLIEYHAAATWPAIWRAICSDEEFGRRLFLRYTHKHSFFAGGPLAAALSEEQLAALFLWMEHHFPQREDPVLAKAGHAQTDREGLAEWREALIRSLAERGTVAAVQQLRSVERVLHDRERFFWLINRAEKSALAGSWPRPTVAQILELAGDHETNLVESERQLLETVIASIQRYARRLHGETPIAFTLWDKDRPKDEESLSDALADHLRVDLGRRGVIASREVQIRRRRGKQRGERNDIHVDAIAFGDAPKRYKTITVIVEVKGCWNVDVLTAMETQLRDRYLKESHCQHGLYLVGWFLCDSWTTDDGRERATIRNLGNSLADARARFEQQAKELSQKDIFLSALVIDASMR